MDALMRKPTSSTQLAAFLFVDSRWHEPHDAVQCCAHGSPIEFLSDFQTEFFSNFLFEFQVVRSSNRSTTEGPLCIFSFWMAFWMLLLAKLRKATFIRVRYFGRNLTKFRYPQHIFTDPPQCQGSLKSVQKALSWYKRTTDGWTDISTLTGVFHKDANAPKGGWGGGYWCKR